MACRQHGGVMLHCGRRRRGRRDLGLGWPTESAIWTRRPGDSRRTVTGRDAARVARRGTGDAARLCHTPQLPSLTQPRPPPLPCGAVSECCHGVSWGCFGPGRAGLCCSHSSLALPRALAAARPGRAGAGLLSRRGSGASRPPRETPRGGRKEKRGEGAGDGEGTGREGREGRGARSRCCPRGRGRGASPPASRRRCCCRGRCPRCCGARTRQHRGSAREGRQGWGVDGRQQAGG